MSIQKDYWRECMSVAADECGLSMTEEQLEYMAKCAGDGHESYGMAFGYDVADMNFISDEKRELDRIKSAQEKHERWVSSTKPCIACTTKGFVPDVWGRDVICLCCNGEGRH